MKTIAGTMKFLGVAGLLLAATAVASADGVKVVKLDQIGQQTKSANAWSNPRFFEVSAQTLWKTVRPDVEKAMKLQLGAGNRIAKGITLYNITCNLGKTISDVKVVPQNGRVLLSFRLNGNYIQAKSTTPGPLGKWADPKFEVRFDLMVTIDVAIPGRDLQFKAGKATAKIMKIRVDSQGVVADAVLVFNRIANFFTKLTTGKKVLISAVEAKTFTISKNLNQTFGSVNKALKQLAANKFRLRSAAFDPKTKQVVVTMLRKTNQLVNRNNTATAVRRVNPGAKVSLNPQPLPPKNLVLPRNN